MSNLRISIIIPAYNEARHIAACLDSIAAQTIQPFEVIVVDNNSTDNTAEIAASHPFVKIVKENKQGIVQARNTGFDAATGDIIGRIDADTLLPQNWVKLIEEFFVSSDRTSAFTGGCYFYNLHSGHLTGRVYDLMVHRLNRALLGYYFPWGSNSAFLRSAWQEVRQKVCSRSDIHEDLDLGIHLQQAGYKTEYKSDVRVGAVARRIVTQRGDLWPYLVMWPRTFRLHRVRRWWLIWPLVVMVWLGSYWILIIETIASVFAQ